MENKIQKPKAIILAAGEGTRLRPYTLDRPKCLVEVEGKSLLDRQLAVLATERVTEVALIGGYKAEMLKRDGISLHLNPRYYETNMVWTLFCAEPSLEGGALLCYGDIVYSRQALQALLAAPGDIAVTIDLDWEVYWRARNEDPLDDAETLKLAADGRILEIGQKPKSLAEIEGQYMGLIKLSALGARQLRQVFHESSAQGSLRGKPPEKAYMTDLLQAMIDLGYRLDSVPVRGGWVEVDTVSDLESEVTRARLSEIESGL
ncbi:NTP transferase domain-containing protein [Dechloromonas denitrificans]|uniref:phosphocholine cytidylyltransferase family protein n=1 Tax=Dechloromonas denitrificans TaxID=281362 RepID=UPI001CF95035|nr:phosphocholine cytidylyltransferase family protein [Dechloromonas denitrificans]UCV06666.1 phosphocholine cytidylyltransferase family protein [Dechloromonas denitrificans]